MSARYMNLVFSVAVFSGIIGAGFMTGCSSSGGNSVAQDTGSESADHNVGDVQLPGDNPTTVDVTAFDGSWRTDCEGFSIFGVPEDQQPTGYVQSTLILDGVAGTYSDRRQFYTDSGCSIEDANRSATGVSGQIQFEGNSTTQSGLEATIVRYLNDNGGPPVLVGLLYRDDNVLYRELRESTLVEDAVPGELALSAPWRLVN